MPKKTSRTKDEPVSDIIARQKAVIDQKILEPVLIDLLVPLAVPRGRSSQSTRRAT